MSLRMGSNQGMSRANPLDKRVPRNPRYADVESKASAFKIVSWFCREQSYDKEYTVAIYVGRQGKALLVICGEMQRLNELRQHAARALACKEGDDHMTGCS